MKTSNANPVISTDLTLQERRNSTTNNDDTSKRKAVVTTSIPTSARRSVPKNKQDRPAMSDAEDIPLNEKTATCSKGYYSYQTAYLACAGETKAVPVPVLGLYE
jgi:hypothetical protein